MMNKNFINFLKKHKKESFFLINPRGNSGDILINKGFDDYLNKNNFKVVDNISKADNIVISGGGYMNDIWEVGIPILKKICSKYPNKRVIVAPNFYLFFKTNFEELLNKYKSEIHLFSRDRYSLERLRKMNFNSNIKLYLSDDVAFFLEKSDYIEDLKKKKQEKYILISFRRDIESKLLDKKKLKFFEIIFDKIGLKVFFGKKYYKEFGKKYHKQVSKKFIHNNQLSKKGKIIISDVSLKPFNEFESLILNASEIYTDRLHVGVFGALLRKKVYLYPASYKKIEGVYEQTLKNFKNIIKKF